MGFTVVGLGIVGLSVFFIAMSYDGTLEGGFDELSMKRGFQYLTGFGFGASSIALFARVAGGIYTKAADVGADLVGKVEEDMDEDHANNPAVIADNVGDNVGDVAGMGADLFESYVGSIIAAGSLAKTGDLAEITFPFWIAGSGILAAIVGSKLVRTKEGAKQEELLHSLHMGINSASVLVLIFSAVISYLLFNDERGWSYFGCVAIGLVSGIIIGQATEFFTSYSYSPVQSITASGVTGPATVIIQGFGAGMLSCLPPAVVLVVTIIACSSLGGTYGVAIAAVGMLSTLGVTLATDAYGPVADNAGGIAEMCDLPDKVRELTDKLDALGNTTAATGKGFAIGSAVLTALSLLASFKKDAGLSENDDPSLNVITDVADPIVLGGIIFGAVLPFLFAALTMLSVRKAATSIILEVRRQFQLNPRLKDPNYQWNEEGKDGPDYKQCIEISTKSSVDEMYLPGGLAILTPLFIGFLVGPKCLSGVLAGAIASGFMMAVMMSNAGGAWDNAKKYIEMEKHVQETYGGKGSEKFKDVKNACVVGDTVGDPFKDTSGPALNILIKLMSMVSLVFAPLMEKEDWALWYVGIIILVVEIILGVVVYNLYWKGFEERTAAAQAKFDAAKQADKTEEAKTAEVEMQPAESDALL
jgi:inorganic pyrophosphatase